MTPLLSTLNKPQSETKSAALQHNYAAPSEQEALLHDYAELIAGLPQHAEAWGAAGDTDRTDTTDALVFIAAEPAAEVVPAAPMITEPTSGPPLNSAQGEAMAAALHIFDSFAAERSVFYSAMHGDAAADQTDVHALSQWEPRQSISLAATAAATTGQAAAGLQSSVAHPVTAQTAARAAEQSASALPPQNSLTLQGTLPLQDASLQQFLRQAVRTELQDSPAVVASQATAAAPGNITAAPEQVAPGKADLAGLQSSQWGQKLVHLLSDKINMQLGQQVQRAQIRLDPPQLGVIELSVSVDGDRTSVQLYAANSQLRDAMQQHLDQLRQQLAQRLGAEHSLELDVREQAQQQAKQPKGAVQPVASQQADDETELTTAATRQSTGWLDRLV